MNKTKFFQACASGDLTTVLNGLPTMDLSDVDDENFRALTLAAKEGHLDVVKALIPVSDVTYVEDENGWTALLWAIHRHHFDVACALIPHSDVQFQNHAGNNALMFAVARDQRALVDILIPLSDVPLRRAHDQCTVLMVAAAKNFSNVVQRLIPGSDVQATNKNGESALMLAIKEKAWESADLLIDHYATLPDWPEQAEPEDLPRWYSRMEQQVLSVPQAPLQNGLNARERARL